MGFYTLLHGLFLTQGSNLCLLQFLLAGEFFTVEPQGKPNCYISHI